MIQLLAGRIPSGRALAVKVEPSSEVSPAVAASIPCAKLTAAELHQTIATAFPLVVGNRKTIAAIQAVVAEFYGISPSFMKRPDGKGSRDRVVARPRQVAMYLAREITQFSTTAIGKQFGGRDHSTVVWAISQVGKRAFQDPKFWVELETLRKRLGR
jgi:chromosomal replication initiator protein